MFTDKNGLIVQSNGDGGDTAQRTGFYFAVRQLKLRLGLNCLPMPDKLANFSAALCFLINNQGLLIRNPIKYDYPFDKDFGTSRDQTTPMIIACGLGGYVASVKMISPRGIIPRYPNGDVASPDNLNQIRRALGKSPRFLGDSWAMGGAFIRCAQAKRNPDDVGDDLNCFLGLAFSAIISPTATSLEALKIYLSERPTNFGVIRLGEPDPVIGAIAWYNRPEGCYRPPGEAGGNPELADECRDLVRVLRTRTGAKL